MNTKEWLSDYIATQPKEQVALLVGLMLSELYARQTELEKVSEHTMVYNSVGFTAFDSKSGSMDAKAYEKYGSLSDLRVARWTKKGRNGTPRICKYHGQVSKEALEVALSTSSIPPKDILIEARQDYARIRGLFGSGSDFPAKEFDSLVGKQVGEQAKPEQWVTAAQKATVPCRRCASTGRFVTMVENGIPKGPGGICFRCGGKGQQTIADAHRNIGYDKYGHKSVCC